MAKPKYSPETKLAVVNHYLSGKDGEQSTADLFGIERTSVRRWLDVYNDAGAEGLLNMQCGRPGQMTKPKNIPPLTDKELEKLSPEELRAELRY
ncbi:TPA: helix-turn-helix domain-containing protein, partial [Klebsiella pneumoniae]|nr:helix-turn-helix domain-containing protein [Klebsiella pneumoniae]